jgi:hypothetical protein
MRVATRTALAGLAVVASAVPAVAQQPAPVRTSVQRLYSFDGVGDAVLLLSGTVDPGKGRALFAQVDGEADKTGSAPTQVYFPDVMDLDNRDAHTFGALGQQDLCVDPQTVCHALPNGGLSFSSSVTASGDGTHQWHLRFAIVVRGAKVTFKERMIGWRARDLGAVHQVTDDEAVGAGATAYGMSAGATVSASAPAGKRGSIAIAAPPCDIAGGGVALLSGPGVTATPGVCPTDAFGAGATAGGTWQLAGPVAGVSARSTRLLVLDL